MEATILAVRILQGAWRANPPPLALTYDEFLKVEPLLRDCGVSALAWNRLRSIPAIAASVHVQRLHNDARVLAIKDAVYDHLLGRLIAALNAEGIEPVLFKGWAVAQSYGSSHFRPYGDFDLLVRQRDLPAARRALANHGPPSRTTSVGGDYWIGAPHIDQAVAVDLHGRLPRQYRSPNEAIFARAKPIRTADGGRFHVPCPEDHLRIVALHLLRHGGFRPIWLCDVAALVEQAGGDFDWDLCLTSDLVTRGWIEAAIACARTMLTCHTAHLPSRLEIEHPAWLMSELMEQWRRPNALRNWTPRLALSLSYLGHKIRQRWPDPIAAAFLLGRPVRRQSSLPVQCAGWVSNVLISLGNLADPQWRPHTEEP